MKRGWEEFKDEVKRDWGAWCLVSLLALIAVLIDLLLVTHWLR